VKEEEEQHAVVQGVICLVLLLPRPRPSTPTLSEEARATTVGAAVITSLVVVSSSWQRCAWQQRPQVFVGVVVVERSA
jgi:hypothetical protein